MTVVDDSPGLQLEARQRLRRHELDVDPDSDLTAQLVGKYRRHGLIGLDFDGQLLHRLTPAPHDPELGHVELPDDGFDGRRIDVDAADDHEIVQASDESAREEQEGPPAPARPMGLPDEVAGAIADDRPARPSEARQ